MKELKITKGKIVLIDDEDFEKVSQYNWISREGRNTSYAKAHIGSWKDRKFIHLHNLIMNTPAGCIVDHLDHNGLNNQKSNLRLCTNSQNSKNRTSWGKSKYLGVSPRRQKDKISWKAEINSENKRKYLGVFESEEAAANAYNVAALELNGKYANLNIIEYQIEENERFKFS